jgi:hypothetical protein
MSGNDRARFCAQCQKHVYNLSNLSADEASALIRSKEGSLCARFYQRADGTVLIADCPVGASHIWVRVKQLLTAAAALVVISGIAPFVASNEPEMPRAKPRVHRAWDDALVTVKGWLGRPQPRMVMGEICVAPPSIQPKTPPSISPGQ